MSTLLDYKAWHCLQVSTGDIDPVYPVLDHLASEWHLDHEQRAWLCVCHVAFYHLGSTLTMFQHYPSPGRLPATEAAMADSILMKLPCTTERRGHRPLGPRTRHLLGLRQDLMDGLWEWLGADGWEWPRLNERIMQLRGNGRWAAYKLAEMLEKVAYAPTAATDAGHRYSTGPRKGLTHLYPELPEGQDDASIRELDAMTEALQRFVGEKDVAQVETSLCDFNSLVKGRYYLGHDIDSMLEVLQHPATEVPKEVWAARAAVFEPELLGEQQGWSGVRRELKTAYRDHRILDWRQE